ncbi:protein transport protein sec31-like [Corvus kubaryi]|uniref:protein transport protein sec31-like n=2 Tax=Corvus TaxID=30420 RepID=UPI001C04D8D6|nr:protein transport protein sec31-like [Corvus kubaryi]
MHNSWSRSSNLQHNPNETARQTRSYFVQPEAAPMGGNSSKLLRFSWLGGDLAETRGASLRFLLPPLQDPLSLFPSSSSARERPRSRATCRPEAPTELLPFLRPRLTGSASGVADTSCAVLRCTARPSPHSALRWHTAARAPGASAPAAAGLPAPARSRAAPPPAGDCPAPAALSCGGLSPEHFSGFHTPAGQLPAQLPTGGLAFPPQSPEPARAGGGATGCSTGARPQPAAAERHLTGPRADPRELRPSQQRGADKLSRTAPARGSEGRWGSGATTGPAPPQPRRCGKGGRASGQPSARYLSWAVAGAVPEPPHHGADRHLLLQQQLQNRRHSRRRSRRARAQPAPGAGPACPPFPRGRRRAGIPAGEAGGGRAPSPCQHAGHGAPAPVRARLFLSCAVFPSPAGLGAWPSGGGTRGPGCKEGQRRPPPLPAAPRPPARRHPRRRMAEDSPKRRKANFNEAETEVLIEQVLKHEQLLFAAGPGRASAGQKRKVWELIRHKVNPVAACPRDVEDLKKRWRDLKRRDRSKLCRLSQGCGPPAPPALGLLLAPEELPPTAAPPARRQRRAYGSLLPAEAVPIVGGIDTLELPGAVVGDMGFNGNPGPSHQSSLEQMNLKEEIVVKVVEPEESSEDMVVVPPSQEQLPFLGTSGGGSSGKVKAKTKGRSQADQNKMTEEDLLQIQQTQIQVIQSGFDSVNHNLRLLQQGMQDLSNSISIMAHTLVAIKNVYVKNNTGPTTHATASTQTTAGYLSPGSPQLSPAKDRGRAQVAGSSSRSSSCSSSSMSQEPGPSEFPRPPLRSIKKEHPNGCYYFCFADV